MLKPNFKQIEQFIIRRHLVIMLLSVMICLCSTNILFAQSAAKKSQTTNLGGFVDVAVAMSDFPDPVPAGGNITYTIIVGNNFDPATNVTLNDTIPANTTFVSFTQDSGIPFSCTTPVAGASGTVSCSISVLPSEAVAQFTLVVKVSPGTQLGTVILNTAIVGASGDSSPTNNTAIEETIVSAPTAASVAVSGRVMSARGRGIRNVLVRLVDEQGQQKVAMTTTFGYFRFVDIPAGQTYTISVSAKKYTFTQPAQVLSLTGEMDDIAFIADN